jgi:hypothetical protein
MGCKSTGITSKTQNPKKDDLSLIINEYFNNGHTLEMLIYEI